MNVKTVAKEYVALRKPEAIATVTTACALVAGIINLRFSIYRKVSASDMNKASTKVVKAINNYNRLLDIRLNQGGTLK